jgi:hypothetical protein
MRPRFHGLQLEEPPSASWLHVGTLRLLNGLQNLRSSKPDETMSGVVWFDRKFDQAAVKFHDTFWKFERAACRLAECVATFKDNSDSLERANVDASHRALADIPLFLDLILLYLRIQADCLANVTPNFYPRSSSIARDSFRDQVAWFTKKQPGFDRAYAQILTTSVTWFETLAGQERGGGLRDVIVHYRGTYALGFNIPETGGSLGLWAAVLSDSGPIESDLIAKLQELVAQYFCFLDQYYEHFVAKLCANGDGPFRPATQEQSRYGRFEGRRPSFWVFPTLSPVGHHAEQSRCT